jgi:hypothetical protein
MQVVLWDTRKLDASKDFAGGFGVGQYPGGGGVRGKIIRHFYKRDRRPAALLNYRTAETAGYDSLLRDEPPKYWASPERNCSPYCAVGILVGRHTEGCFPVDGRRQLTSHNPDVLLI